MLYFFLSVNIELAQYVLVNKSLYGKVERWALGIKEEERFNAVHYFCIGMNGDEGNTTLYLHANTPFHTTHSRSHLHTYTEKSPVAKAKLADE